jgi:acyl-CoA thioesterase I
MKRRCFVPPLAALLIFTALWACGRDEPTPQAAAEKQETRYDGTIVAVGDSLTAGHGLSEDQSYPAQLERKLHAEGLRYRVVNAGISGETSSGTLSRIKWVLTLKPDIVILETGANDGMRGIDPVLTQRNLSEIIEILAEHNVVVVLAGMQILSNLGEGFRTAFKNIYPAVATQRKAILIPFFLEGVAGEPQLNLPDAIHPTEQGYAVVVANLLPYVKEAIRQRKGRLSREQ